MSCPYAKFLFSFSHVVQWWRCITVVDEQITMPMTIIFYYTDICYEWDCGICLYLSSTVGLGTDVSVMSLWEPSVYVVCFLLDPSKTRQCISRGYPLMNKHLIPLTIKSACFNQSITNIHVSEYSSAANRWQFGKNMTSCLCTARFHSNTFVQTMYLQDEPSEACLLTIHVNESIYRCRICRARY